MAAILEMPQYVAYQKIVVYAFIKLSAKCHSFNILCTTDGFSCPALLFDSLCGMQLLMVSHTVFLKMFPCKFEGQEMMKSTHLS